MLSSRDIKEGDFVIDGDGARGEIIEIADNGRWIRLKLRVGGKERKLWTMTRFCKPAVRVGG